jgi:prevent-host-death family protein
MAKKSTRTARRPKGADTIAAAEFKATCLQLMDRVRDTRAEYVVTKHGRPVAKLVPCDQPQTTMRFIGSMKGTVLSYERPTEPLDDVWDVNRDAV